MNTRIPRADMDAAIERHVAGLTSLQRLSYDVEREVVGWSADECWSVGDVFGFIDLIRAFRAYAESPDWAIEALGHLRSAHDVKYVLTALTFSRGTQQRFNCTVQLRKAGGVTRAFWATCPTLAEAACRAALATVRGTPNSAGHRPELHSPIARAVAESGRALHVADLVDAEIALRDREIERLQTMLDTRHVGLEN